MTGINTIKLKSLEQTRNFYKCELKEKDLTEKQRNKYLLALKSIKKIIKAKKLSGEIRERIKIML